VCAPRQLQKLGFKPPDRATPSPTRFPRVVFPDEVSGRVGSDCGLVGQWPTRCVPLRSNTSKRLPPSLSTADLTRTGVRVQVSMFPPQTIHPQQLFTCFNPDLSAPPASTHPKQLESRPKQTPPPSIPPRPTRPRPEMSPHSQSCAWAESHLAELSQDLEMSRAETDEAMASLRAARATQRDLEAQLADARRESDARLRLFSHAERDNRALKAELGEARKEADDKDEANAKLRAAIVALSRNEGGREEAEALEKGLEALLRSSAPSSRDGATWREVASASVSGVGSGSEMLVGSISSGEEGSGVLLAVSEGHGGGLAADEGEMDGAGAGEWIEV